MTVKLRIKELRDSQSKKYTQRYMGDYLGITEGAYRKLESNGMNSIRMDFIDKLCTLFQCEIGDLFVREDP